ncbi:MAG: tRNA preQ1(34) S-adenosylmethionine ribosyltransferase-isomerase QueA [Gemmatimonadota bacterium]|uniref:tRNA preQ1(34) S-adenosylmethionine ribosyltransferase-isomerase QueA n=1 Tax=Candidatus Palauibacter scopulicola TaxID=3056741 RepID=UPI0023A11181|nr:tRNA preQ1(34) S-adenosylmethionine ribosyltransferase-isomerase QueA [Candidatus Palauibacter scopulicola]MDE2663639.1 tRNA preQ1(34) S-adenosylmethionine ribosyltransferase-isomerase QueA [Candidatus Palauibacter scopulicola]
MTDEWAGRTEAYDYELPDELIAARPAARRDGSRLLVLDRARGRFADAAFPALLERLSAGDAVVVNDSRVFPARLLGRKPTGARAEILLVRPESGALASFAPFDEADTRLWRAMVRPGGKLKPGRTVDIADGFAVEILDSAADGTRLVRLAGDDDPWRLIQRHGRVPLPPYIVRDAPGGERAGADDAEDRERYQTVYAAPAGSVAAPTAGLHLTRKMLAGIEAMGVRLVSLTLHVGFGTFRPVTADRIDEHEVAPEVYSFSSTAAEALNATRAEGGRVFAVGTTSCRVLETVAAGGGVSAGGPFAPGRGWTDLFIRPPYTFRAVDALVTNFHLPRSSLLMLVAAFAGRELTLEAYAHAIRQRYRFYSYGDAMLIA